jgi:hypothetical protein
MSRAHGPSLGSRWTGCGIWRAPVRGRRDVSDRVGPQRVAPRGPAGYRRDRETRHAPFHSRAPRRADTRNRRPRSRVVRMRGRWKRRRGGQHLQRGVPRDVSRKLHELARRRQLRRVHGNVQLRLRRLARAGVGSSTLSGVSGPDDPAPRAPLACARPRRARGAGRPPLPESNRPSVRVISSAGFPGEKVYAVEESSGVSWSACRAPARRSGRAGR